MKKLLIVLIGAAICLFVASAASAGAGYDPREDTALPQGGLGHLAQAAMLADEAAYVRDGRGLSKATAGVPIPNGYGTAADRWGQPGDRVPAWYELYQDSVHVYHWHGGAGRYGRADTRHRPAGRRGHAYR